ncbi:hypothetical protein [Streptomyces sp. NPDC046182]|uniref:PTS fructose transporter subunit IIB n=1 Tax=Streptomyces sp. NPDC046182 TaxID=3154601 RepID=UPI0033FBFDA7
MLRNQQRAREEKPVTSPASEERRVRLLAVTACPTGIAHTYMAAEKLTQAAQALGVEMKVETPGSIGAENVLSDNGVRTRTASSSRPTRTWTAVGSRASGSWRSAWRRGSTIPSC